MAPCMLMGVVSWQFCFLSKLEGEIERERVRERTQVHNGNRDMSVCVREAVLAGNERSGTKEGVVEAHLHAGDGTDGNGVVPISQMQLALGPPAS